MPIIYRVLASSLSAAISATSREILVAAFRFLNKPDTEVVAGASAGVYISYTDSFAEACMCGVGVSSA